MAETRSPLGSEAATGTFDAEAFLGGRERAEALTAAQGAVLDAAALIRALREAARLSQAELARRAETHQTHISALESARGRQGPTVETLARIGLACGRPIAIVEQAELDELRQENEALRRRLAALEAGTGRADVVESVSDDLGLAPERVFRLSPEEISQNSRPCGAAGRASTYRRPGPTEPRRRGMTGLTDTLARPVFLATGGWALLVLVSLGLWLHPSERGLVWLSSFCGIVGAVFVAVPFFGDESRKEEDSLIAGTNFTSEKLLEIVRELEAQVAKGVAKFDPLHRRIALHGLGLIAWSYVLVVIAWEVAHAG